MLRKTSIISALSICVLLSPFVLYRIKQVSANLSNTRYLVIEGNIAEGDLLGEVLIANGLTSAQSFGITGAMKDVFDLRRCRVGDRWEIYLTEENEFVKFIYYDGPLDFYVGEFDADSDTYTAVAQQVEAERTLCGAQGSIASSLYESMTFSSISPELIIQFAEIFSSKVDFFTDCRAGDKFTLLWDVYMDKNGNPLKDIQVVAASYSPEGKTYNAFYFENAEGKGGYYDENGKSVETAFLKAPLNYRRISSFFSHRRLHPIHKVYKAHLGIDYAAPKGTPVSSIGNGTVQFSGWRGGFGNTVIIKHPNNYTSWYGHLSKMATGITKGKKVSKGQVIGYVGSTGVSTGPHLDFRIQKGETFVNFLTITIPPAYPLEEKYFPEFNIMKDSLLSKMAEVKDKDTTIIFAENKTK